MANNDWQKILDSLYKKESKEDQVIEPSTLEDIDISLYEYVEKHLNIHATTNSGWEKVPVIWSSAERWFQIKHKKLLRQMLNMKKFKSLYQICV